MKVAPPSTKHPSPPCLPTPADVEVFPGLRALEMEPVSSGRRLAASRQLFTADECYEECYFAKSLSVPYYYAVKDGVCYCAQDA